MSEAGSVQCNLRVSTADACNARFEVDGARIVVRFVDWKDVPRELVFLDPIGARWAGAGEAQPWRDDTTCEVRGSAWLERAAREVGVRGIDHAHNQLGFSEVGMVLSFLAPRRAALP